MLPHAFHGQNYDDSDHVDTPTTTVTTPTSLTMCWQRPLSTVRNISRGLARYIVSGQKLDKNLKHVTPATVKMV
jgi:hypothetical protein